MAQSAADRNRDDDVPTEKKLDDLYKLIDGIEVAMFTTRRPDGHLVSRAMQMQARRSGTDLWFVADWYSDKLDELLADPHVNLAFYNTRTREWVSVAGTAIVSRDRDLIRGLYKEDWKIWFPEEKGRKGRDGGPDDDRIALILVEADSVTYSKKNKPAPLVLFEMAKAFITKTPPKVADLRELDTTEIRTAPVAEKNSQAR